MYGLRPVSQIIDTLYMPRGIVKGNSNTVFGGVMRFQHALILNDFFG